MLMAGDCGAELLIPLKESQNIIHALFAEELGFVLELKQEDVDLVSVLYEEAGLVLQPLGRTTEEKEVTMKCAASNELLLQTTVDKLRCLWESTSFELEKLQCLRECAEAEYNYLSQPTSPTYRVSFKAEPLPIPAPRMSESLPKVGVIREEGSNGDREMITAMWMAGFEVWDITTSDLCSGKMNSLEQFRGLVFVGGFSYADVLGAATGWAGVIRFNSRVRDMLEHFKAREDSFSLGVCNGCQMMALLGWIPKAGLADEEQPRFLRNLSGRFESRYSALLIQKSRSVLLKDMEGSILPVWIAHGEGRYCCPTDKLHQTILDEELAPLRYVDPNGTPTEEYPFNPNGSRDGIAGLCDSTGRHLVS